MGFREESRIRDFYALGDDRVTYCRRYGTDGPPPGPPRRGEKGGKRFAGTT